MPNRIAVVVFQLGGPDSVAAVEPFLYNLFRDPDIIDFPGAFLARRLLAKTISHARAKPIGRHYEEIGGKSPILELTQRQAAALEETLKENGLDARVVIAMRYWHPMTEEAVDIVRRNGTERVVLLPLYPQFSQATTLSSVNEWNRRVNAARLNVPTQLICCYPNHPQLIQAFVENIEATLRKFGDVPQEEIDLIFSAHGVPMAFIKRGDPYQLQIEETVGRVVARGRWKSPHVLCYQSKVGPQEWLKPGLTETVTRLAQRGRKRLLVVPIAFVTEHIETLHEINIEERENAEHLGVEQFEMMPALNDHPKFIQCLAELVLARVNSSADPTSKCMDLWQHHPDRPQPKLCPWFEKR
jgi:ferrochelatase